MLRPARPRHGERGAVMVLAALLLVIVGGFLALSFNAGHGVAVRGELQNAVDSAALAGARELNGSLAGVDAARAFADDFARRHVTDPAVAVAPERIEFGNWDPDARAWTRLEPAAENLAQLNAIRVVAARQEGAPGGGALTAFFGRAFLNRDTFDVNAEAIAYAGEQCAPSSGCDSPFVIRYGCLVRGDLRCDADYEIGLSNATVDTAGFSDMNPQESIEGNPSASSPRICSGVQDTTAVTCSLGTSQLKTSNGTQLNATCPGGMTLCEAIQLRYPPNSEMQVPVVTYVGEENTECNGGQYGGVATVVSTIKMRIKGVRCASGDTGQLGMCAFATGNCLTLHTECDETTQQTGSCVAMGALTQEPVLAR